MGSVASGPARMGRAGAAYVYHTQEPVCSRYFTGGRLAMTLVTHGHSVLIFCDAVWIESWLQTKRNSLAFFSFTDACRG